MPNIFDNQFEHAHELADDGLGGLSSADDIRQNTNAALGEMGQFYTDASSVPTTATERYHDFYHYDDIFEYLESGGLVVWDELGNVVQNPIVHVVEFYDEDDQYYRVWIDDETGED